MRHQRRRNRRTGHARDERSVRPDRCGNRHRDRRRLGRHTMDSSDPWLSSTPRIALVRSSRCTGLSPVALVRMVVLFDAYAPHVFDTGGAIAGGSGLFALLVAIAMSVWRSRQSRLVTTYGSARWADAVDIRKAGLTLPAGVFLGQHDDQYLRHEGPEHVLSFAPTRSGKGVGLVVPTLLSWPASAVIHDIKERTGRSRRAGVRAFALPAFQPHR